MKQETFDWVVGWVLAVSAVALFLGLIQPSLKTTELLAMALVLRALAMDRRHRGG